MAEKRDRDTQVGLCTQNTTAHEDTPIETLAEGGSKFVTVNPQSTVFLRYICHKKNIDKKPISLDITHIRHLVTNKLECSSRTSNLSLMTQCSSTNHLSPSRPTLILRLGNALSESQH